MSRRKVTITFQPLDDLILRATIRDQRLAEAMAAGRRFLKEARRIERLARRRK